MVRRNTFLSATIRAEIPRKQIRRHLNGYPFPCFARQTISICTTRNVGPAPPTGQVKFAIYSSSNMAGDGPFRVTTPTSTTRCRTPPKLQESVCFSCSATTDSILKHDKNKMSRWEFKSADDTGVIGAVGSEQPLLPGIEASWRISGSTKGANI